MFKSMQKRKGICVEIDGVFYESVRLVCRRLHNSKSTIKKRCLSNEFPNYKFVPYRIIYTEKKCTKCGRIKSLDEFDTQSNGRDGIKPQCKQCASEYNEGWRKDNPELIKKTRKKWEEENPTVYKKWIKDNPEKSRGYQKKYKEKKRKDPAFKINEVISRAINTSLNGGKNGAHWESLVGWTAEEGRAHFESLFTEGMSWNNYGKGKYKWNIDHIIAVSKWNITSIECQALKDCWALNNLQPLWDIRNMEKATKPMEPKYLIKPF